MRKNHWGLAMLAIVGWLSLPGCYSMNPYPYGASPYRQTPTMYAPGVPGYPQAAPRHTYIMPGDPVRTVPGSMITSPQPTYPASAPAPAPGNTPRTNGPAAAPASGEKPVPLPRDPEANGANSTVPNRQSSQLQYDDSQRRTTTRSSVFSLSDVDPNGTFYRPRVSDTRSTSPSPTASSPRSQPLSIAREQGVEQVGYQSTHSHDPAFRWVQGLLQFDPQQRSWHLMYALNPDDDPSGGEVKLSGHLPFTPADHNRMFRIYGNHHDELLDRLGKPQYVVKRIERIAPESARE